MNFNTLLIFTLSLFLFVACKENSSLNTDDNNNVKSGEVKIGTQTWMKKNLDVEHYRNGDPIPNITIDYLWLTATEGAWCYYQNQTANGVVYGKLYNWYAVNDPRGLAPEGWHIPSSTEWDVMIKYLGGNSVAGGKLKESGTTHWLSPNYSGNNQSGFTALGSGWATICDGPFADLGKSEYYWLSNSSKTSYAYYVQLNYLREDLVFESYPKVAGMSVRCIKD